MPLVDIHVKDRNNPDKTITLKRYVIDSKDKPTAIVFGKFSPWHKGHQTLIDTARKISDDIMIVSPTREETTKGKYDANIFTMKQKEEIIEKITKLPFNRINGSVLSVFRNLLDRGIKRPVFVVGEDRKDDFAQFFIEYNKNNKAITNEKDKNFGKGEMLINKKRLTSATEVRKALVDGDLKAFIKASGYDEKMYKYFREMLKKNKIIESAEIWL